MTAWHPNTQNHKVAIIAGNAPSLAKIDYTRKPNNFNVFRCNQFYFEDSYFLGSEIEAVFFNPSVFLHQYFTLKHLQKTKQYKAKHIIFSNFGISFGTIFEEFDVHFPDATLGYEHFKKLKEFDSFCKFNHIYMDNRITSGVYMCAVAIAMGYTELYLVGIDFYENHDYAFDTKKPNLLKINPSFNNDVSKKYFHTREFDVESLRFLQETYKIKIYSLSSHSPMSNYFPLAPVTHSDLGDFVPNPKRQDATKDILLSNANVPLKPDLNKLELLENLNKPESLRENIYLTLIKDLIRLPQDTCRVFIRIFKRSVKNSK